MGITGIRPYARYHLEPVPEAANSVSLTPPVLHGYRYPATAPTYCALSLSVSAGPLTLYSCRFAFVFLTLPHLKHARLLVIKNKLHSSPLITYITP